jgi:hypothetical protein
MQGNKICRHCGTECAGHLIWCTKCKEELRERDYYEQGSQSYEIPDWLEDILDE